MDTNIQTAPAETAPVAKAKKPIYKRWWAIALAAFFVIIIMKATTGGDDPTPAVADKPAASAPAQAAAPKPAAKPKAPASQIGKPVRDGKFQFTVNSVKCGIS